MTSDPAEPASRSRPAGPVTSDLPLRAISGVGMAGAALAVTWYGGVVFALFWTAAAGVVFWEWRNLVSSAAQPAVWLAAGVVYAVAVAAAPIVLRADGEVGLLAVVFLFAVVWTTDMAAYFGGRFIGGAKLWPAVSPNKTWSGAIAGMLGAIGAAIAVAICGAISLWPAAALGAIFSIASQAGDLFESHLKRRFGVKDSSHVIPGHGGVMDRLDGFIAAASVAALVGLARGGLAHPGRGMLIW
jgi:phosphatidate cytidylyltransferase